MIFQWLIPHALRDNVLVSLVVFGLGISAITGSLYLAKDLIFLFLKELLTTLLEVVSFSIENTFVIVGRLLFWPFDLIEFLFLRNTLLYKKRRFVLEVIRDTTQSEEIFQFLDKKLHRDTSFNELRKIENGLETLAGRLNFISESFPNSLEKDTDHIKVSKKITILEDTFGAAAMKDAS